MEEETKDETATDKNNKEKKEPSKQSNTNS